MINIIVPESSIPAKKLNFGGTRPDGETVEVNSLYFTKNGKPWLPVMGEFHFSRYPESEWESSLAKMKAGGVDIVATYIFWIHHEEIKGKWDFSGNRNLRKFIEACNKVNIQVLLRIGPWSHGECRNGGFPDWLVHDSSITARTNDSVYLNLVHTFFNKIYEQAKGFFWKDNGPIVGIQLENEYGHCGGPNGEEGKAHLRTLKKMAVDIGFDTPLYTATAWGGAVVIEGETLPVVGGYIDAPWAGTREELPPNPNFLIQTSLNDPLIGSDHKHDDCNNAFTCNINDYPYITAELGGGMQPTHHRRVVAFTNDTMALALCKLASGANLLGYYMYHGGTNPDGVLSTLQESIATGYPNDVAVKSYDFEAPIAECGIIHKSFKELKKIHMFLKEWGELLAPAKTVIPNENAVFPDDLKSLRISLRHNSDANCGFIFLNNHLRKRALIPHRFDLHISNSKLNIDIRNICLKTDDMKILPYNLKLGNATLIYSNAEPLTRIADKYFFFTDETPEYIWGNSQTAQIITLSCEEASNSFKFGDKLYISDAALFENHDYSIMCETFKESEEIVIYSESDSTSTYTVQNIPASADITFDIAIKNDSAEYVSYNLNLSYELSTDTTDCILKLNYNGDKAEIYSNGKLIADWFTNGQDFNTALKRYGYPKTLEVKIYPSEDNIYYDIPVQDGMELISASVIPLYTKKIQN